MTETYTVPVYVFIGTFPDTTTPMTVISSRANRVLGIYGYDWIVDHVSLSSERSTSQGYRIYEGFVDVDPVTIFVAATHTNILTLLELLRLKRIWVDYMLPSQFGTLGRVQNTLSANGLSPRIVVSQCAGYTNYVVTITYFASNNWNPMIDREFLTAWRRAS